MYHVSPIKNGVFSLPAMLVFKGFLTNRGGEAAVPWKIPIDTWTTQVPGITRTIARWLKKRDKPNAPCTHRINVWHIFTYLSCKSTIHVAKYTSPMDPMEICLQFTVYCVFFHAVVCAILLIAWSIWQHFGYGGFSPNKKWLGKMWRLIFQLFVLFGSSKSHRWGGQFGASPKNHLEFELWGPYR